MSKLSFEELITQLTPTMRQIEEKRLELKQEALKKSSINGGLILSIALIVGLFTNLPVLLGIGVILLIPCSIINYNRGSEILRSIYKAKIISRLVESLIEDGRYEPQSGISEQTFNKSNLFNVPDRYGSEDYISGKMGQTPFGFAEVHAEEKHIQTDSKGRTTTTWSTLFKGFLFVADFNKDFAGQTVIYRNSIFNFIKSNRVKLENPEFEKRFDVYSSDQVEARYILSPAMMERVIALDKQFSRGILISFYNSSVVIAVNNSRDHFESSLWSSVNQTKTLRDEYDTIVALTSIIEVLDLNTRIWTKK